MKSSLKTPSESIEFAAETRVSVPQPPLPPVSLRQPAWHVLLLGILSCKLYLVYWCYKNWRDLSSHMQALPSDEIATPPTFLVLVSPGRLSSFRDCNPLLRMLCTCLPYVNDYLFLTIAMGAARLQPGNSAAARNAVGIAVGLTLFSVGMSFFALQKGHWYWVSFLSVLPFMYVQHLINRYWDTVEPRGLLFRAGFTFNELAVIIVGALLFGFIVAGFIMGANPS